MSPGFPLFCRSRILAVFALCLATAGTATAQSPDRSVGDSASEISVTAVEIPVEVTSRGEPVRGLTAADFEVLEDERPLSILAVETVDLTAPPRAGEPQLSPAARRHMLFLFDFALSRPERLRNGVTAAREIVASGLDPRDLAAVGIYLPTGELHLLLSFTTDRAAASRTLEALDSLLDGKKPEVAAGKPDPLRLTGLGARTLLTQAWQVNETNFAADMLASLGSTDNSMGATLQSEILAHSAALHQPNVEARQRGHIKAMADAVSGLSEILRSVDGRKYLAFFSEGFSMHLASQPPGSVDRPTQGGSDLLVSLHSMLNELRRSGWVLHGVDVAGLRPQKGGSDSLFFLANETGGTLVEGTNRLAEGLDRALRRSAHSYLLTVQADVEADGSYHPLEVRLRGDRRGVKVLHRDGYFAPLPFTRQKDVQRLADAAILVASEDQRDDLGIQIAAVPLHSDAETTRVAVLVEIPGGSLLASGAPRLGVEVFGYALDAAGNSSDFFAQAAELDPARVGSRLAQGGVRVLARLDLPPGPHRLRVLARDRHNGRVSLLTVPLSVADMPAGTSALEALFLPPADDPWVLVRPEAAAFDLHGRAILPAARATLPASGEAQLVVVGRGLAGEGAWIKERILDSAGRPVAGGALEIQSMTPGEAGEPDLLMARLQAGTLPPGRYLLELRAGRATRTQAVSLRPFEIAAQDGR